MTTGNYELLKLGRAGHVATITLNRPEKLNALSRTLMMELHRALDEAAADGDIRAVILTGAGRGFCSGTDVNLQLESLEGQAAAEGPSPSEAPNIASHVRSISQPVIAAVNGVAAGAGLAIALASDIRIASEEARFSSIFVKRSSIPDTCTSYMLPTLVGYGTAMEMVLTGNIYGAQWALERGLVNRVVPADKLLEEAISVANDIAANPPICVRSTKQLLYQHGQNLEKDVLPKEGVANDIAHDNEDRAEAIRSFLEKRQPVFKGR